LHAVGDYRPGRNDETLARPEPAAERRIAVMGHGATADLRSSTTGPIRIRVITGDSPIPRTTTAPLDGRGDLHQDFRPLLLLEEVVSLKVLEADDLPRRHRPPPP
jgi:hypothetical protein